MIPHLHEPGRVSTTSCGRVFIICYQQPTSVALEERVWADYLRHREGWPEGTLVLCSAEASLPLPDVEVRAYWRESMRAGSGVLGFATINRGFVGLAGAAMTHLLEHLVDPIFGIRFRVFTQTEPAIEWLADVAPLDASEAELNQALARLRASG